MSGDALVISLALVAIGGAGWWIGYGTGAARALRRRPPDRIGDPQVHGHLTARDDLEGVA